ncbi:phenylalanine--tRNA ligase subunit beta [candidate division KSB1 bacterium]|nr:MAG: phenylalanine--tRNA ligase subunit beta [candidate division KSB1 bacterium]
MKFTYNWLREFVDTPLTAEALAERLPMIGFEVESCQSLLPDLKAIVVGKVLVCENIPASDHLKRCEVNIGSTTLNVVCGAPNVAVDQLVAVAPSGTRLPNGLTIEARKIFGVQSQGMICSEMELGLSDEHEGILVLNGQARVGQHFVDTLEQDWLFDIAVTPNRPDALGIIGIAREVGLITGAPLQLPKIKLRETGAPIEQLITIQIKDAEGCPRYAARIVKNIAVKPSPKWMRQRLNAVGVRAISNIVDVTNYVMMETGQPQHAFDYDLLEKDKIIVQRARAGEKFQTLDGQEHELLAEDVMICDGHRNVALAGVMGGLNSEVSDATKNILIECAHFNPLAVRRTAKRLGMTSEAGRRFERGTDPNGIPFAVNRAAQLMQDTAGGEIARGIAEVYPAPIKPAKITLRPKRVTHVLGGKVPSGRMEKILTGLECKVSKKSAASWQVAAPTFRPDLTREIDLIEEIARIYGYDKFSEKLHSQVFVGGERNREEEALEKLRRAMTGLGFDEAITIDLISPKLAGLFLPEGGAVLPLINPLNEELSVLRPAVAATLLHSLAYNLNRKNRDVWLYETGAAFWKEPGKEICEEQRLAAIAVGAAENPNWLGKTRGYALPDLRGVLEVLERVLLLPKLVFKPLTTHAYLEHGWEIFIGANRLGFAGKLRAEILKEYDVETDVFLFELKLQEVIASIDWQRTFQSIPKYPPVERDLAIIVDHDVPAEKIYAVIESASDHLLERLELFDLYTGKPIPAGKKSMAFALTFRADDRTLRDEEVELRQKNILDALGRECGAVLRT